MSKLRIAITGVTGLIGRNLFFEIIKQNLHDLDNLEIFALGRDLYGKKLEDRISTLIDNDGREYISSSRREQEKVIYNLNSFVKCIHIDLARDNLELCKKDFKTLSKHPISIFYHIGASTDLRLGPVVEQRSREVNVNGTLRILGLISTLDVGEFCYVGTAYSCGDVNGKVLADSINLNQKFRNPYEKTKLEAEMLVREYAKKSKMKFRYFRPSVTCGRLIEKPLGSISKFDVFYGWAAFFLGIKNKNFNLVENIYDTKVNLDIRIYFNKNGGLNIVPVDYVAKLMYLICVENIKGDSFHLVSERDTPHKLYTSLLLKEINVEGYRFVNQMPNDLNHLEKLYYKTAGSVFTSYVIIEKIKFCTKNIKTLIEKKNIKCPKVDKKNLHILSGYAKKFNFGINLKQSL
ncbi:MAG: SDR family oxidoreductase [Candidatus Omnitrophica bacterium]|nr:SDR family oxidoreductase [Candidatus Omnitrophota bacterium]